MGYFFLLLVKMDLEGMSHFWNMLVLWCTYIACLCLISLLRFASISSQFIIWQEDVEPRLQNKDNMADIVCCMQHLQVPSTHFYLPSYLI